MAISSRQLEAFSAVARLMSFSVAAKSIHITQSALSQRISGLEQELGTTLLIRESSGIRPTPAGEQLLRYCQTKDSLEAEVIGAIHSDQMSLSGSIRIGGFSSIMRSVLMPSIRELLRENPLLSVDLVNREISELPRLLANGAVDFIITTESSKKQNVVYERLGYEKNVMVESKSELPPTMRDTFLDHDQDDSTTLAFHQLNGLPTDLIKRRYLDEVYAIIDGVKLGWGRAVLPAHLIKWEKAITIVKGKKPLKTPVFLAYFNQPYYSKLHQKLVETISTEAPLLLAK